MSGGEDDIFVASVESDGREPALQPTPSQIDPLLMDKSESFPPNLVLSFAQGGGFAVSDLTRRGLSVVLRHDFNFALVRGMPVCASLFIC